MNSSQQSPVFVSRPASPEVIRPVRVEREPNWPRRWTILGVLVVSTAVATFAVGREYDVIRFTDTECYDTSLRQDGDDAVARAIKAEMAAEAGISKTDIKSYSGIGEAAWSLTNMLEQQHQAHGQVAHVQHGDVISFCVNDKHQTVRAVMDPGP